MVRRAMRSGSAHINGLTVSVLSITIVD